MKKIQCAIGACMLGLVGASALAEDQKGFYIGAGIGGEDRQAYVGYQFSDRFAVEAGYLKVDGFLYELFTGDDLEFEGTQASLVGLWPLSDRSAIVGKIGAYSWDSTENGDDSDSGTSAIASIAYQYSFDAEKKWAARVGVDVISEVGTMFGYSINYRF